MVEVMDTETEQVQVVAADIVGSETEVGWVAKKKERFPDAFFISHFQLL
jgi:hypothetical protein